MLERGREACRQRAWLDAHASLTEADAAEPLGPDDLELLATAAYMLGRDDEWVAVHERAHHLHLAASAFERAAFSAFWIGFSFALRGDVGQASGWFGRAQRLLDTHELDSVVRGYLLIPAAIGLLMAREFTACEEAAAGAAAVAGRFGDVDLAASAVLTQGQALALGGRVPEGLALLDEAMVAVSTGEISPVLAGVTYCAVILTCQQVFEVRRAREWTLALDRWWKEQPDMVAFTGRCLVHRAEILQLGGSWPAALDEARRARRRFIETGNAAAGLAHYREGELLRLQGDFAAAEAAYSDANRAGWAPQPGLAQLRLAQGRADAATAAIRRACTETSDPLRRAELLPARVEIMLALDELDDAETACTEVEEIAGGYASAMLAAMAAYARGAIELARGETQPALASLRRALAGWQTLEAPYEVARTRVLIAEVCRVAGDDDSCRFEREAALAAFAELGAEPDRIRLEHLAGTGEAGETHGLSPRELEVLRLLAAGKSNRQIATALVISEHTAARHVQNIFAKLRVSSRAAATAFAFEHGLV